MKFSETLVDQVEKRIATIDSWQAAIPIALGSWARGELCPKSDLDMIFLGDEKKVHEIVKCLQSEGFKIRARVPEDLADWTVGVQSRDIVALLRYKALTPVGEARAQQQRQRILEDRKLKQKIFREVLAERKERARRFDSINSFLEPNIKLGPGGLRDIEQALQIVTLLDSKKDLSAKHHSISALRQSKAFLLQIRLRLHEAGYIDQLVGTEQAAIGHKLGFKSLRDFMREVSRTLSRADFYSGWVCDYFKSSRKKRSEIEAFEPKSPMDLMKIIRQDQSFLAQRLIRSKMDKLHQVPLSDRQRGLLLREAILFRTSEAQTHGIFQSLWICKLSPVLKPLIGYVQHDQYHRLSAEAHVLQTCKEIKRAWKSPKKLGALAGLTKSFTPTDWEVLSWVALYHDIAKGQEGDHAILGAEVASREMQAFEIKSEVVDKVVFLVKHHLQLSLAAFRKNPQDPKTWREFFELGFDGKLMRLLAVFTAIDIRATNIDAWNEWKANLLNQAVLKFDEPTFYDFFTLEKKLNSEFSAELTASLDPLLLQYFSVSTIEKDLLALSKGASSPDLDGSEDRLKIIRDRKRHSWVRIQRPLDQSGLLERYVKSLFQAGASIEQAVIQTLPGGIGVYDLFQIKMSASSVQMLKRIKLSLSQKTLEITKPPPIKLQRIEVVAASDKEVVLSFKGVDQRGLLWAITSELQQHQVSIVSARVHTWGGQIEDLIHIRPITNVQGVIDSLNCKWLERKT